MDKGKRKKTLNFKPFKFIVHKTVDGIFSEITLFQNFSSLQFIINFLNLFFTYIYFKTFQVYSSLRIHFRSNCIYKYFKTFQVYSSSKKVIDDFMKRI